jgi:hypothetical protein
VNEAIDNDPGATTVPKRTYVGIAACQDWRTYVGIAACQDWRSEGMLMPKSAVVGRALRRQGRPRPAALRNVVEGQITEICRDLAVEAKRMRQLHEQADELRSVIRQWAATAKRNRTATRLIVEDDAEQ